MIITSENNQKIKNLKKLLEPKNILKENKFIIEGSNLVKEAYKHNLIEEVYALETYDNPLDLEVTIINEKIMKALTDLKSLPKVIAVSRVPNKKELGSKIVLLDNVQDPGNVGTIIRNCVAFGVDTIVLSNDSAKPYTPKVLRSAVGMIYNINIIIDDLENIIYKIKEKNIPLIGAALSAQDNIDAVNKDKYAIVFGNEGSGIKQEIIDKCDKKIKIEMEKSCESLNVAVSNAIILYNIYKGE